MEHLDAIDDVFYCPGGVIRKDESGEPNGVLEENAHFATLGKLLQVIDADLQHDAAALARMLDVTTVILVAPYEMKRVDQEVGVVGSGDERTAHAHGPGACDKGERAARQNNGEKGPEPDGVQANEDHQGGDADRQAEPDGHDLVRRAPVDRDIDRPGQVAGDEGQPGQPPPPRPTPETPSSVSIST